MRRAETQLMREELERAHGDLEEAVEGVRHLYETREGDVVRRLEDEDHEELLGRLAAAKEAERIAMEELTKSRASVAGCAGGRAGGRVGGQVGGQGDAQTH